MSEPAREIHRKYDDSSGGGGLPWPCQPRHPGGACELLLEPNDNPAARTFQKAVFEQGIPTATFGVDDLEREYERLQKLGVVFRGKPTRTGPVLTAVLEDTCGNLIQLAQK